MSKYNKWTDLLIDPDSETHYIITDCPLSGLTTTHSNRSKPYPEYTFRKETHAEIIKRKMVLMQVMSAFAHVRNQGWKADWSYPNQCKFGIGLKNGEPEVQCVIYDNILIFGIAVRTELIAKEMLFIFGERIKKCYNLQY